MFRKTRSEQERELDQVLRDISDSPLSSEVFRHANSLIEELEGDDPPAINEALMTRGLPRLDELGKMQAKHGFRFARLHQRRRKLERKLGRA